MPAALRRNAEYSDAAAGGYSALPTVILQTIFSLLLPLRDQPSARATCKTWATAFAGNALAIKVLSSAESDTHRSPSSMWGPPRRVVLTLAEAVSMALPGDTIVLTKGDHDVTSDLVITTPIQIIGHRRKHMNRLSRKSLEATLAAATQEADRTAAAARRSRARGVQAAAAAASTALLAARNALETYLERRSSGSNDDAGNRGLQTILDALQQQQQANDSTLRIMGSIHWMAPFGRIKHCNIRNNSIRNFTAIRVGSVDDSWIASLNQQTEHVSAAPALEPAATESKSDVGAWSSSDGSSSDSDSDSDMDSATSETEAAVGEASTSESPGGGHADDSVESPNCDRSPGFATEQVSLSLVGCSVGTLSPRSAREQSRRTRKAAALVQVDGSRVPNGCSSTTSLYLLLSSIADSTSHGVAVTGRGSCLAARKCVIRSNAGSGIQCLTEFGGRGSHVSVEHTAFVQNKGPGIQIFESDTFAGSFARGIYFDSNNTVATGANSAPNLTAQDLQLVSAWDVSDCYKSRVRIVSIAGGDGSNGDDDAANHNGSPETANAADDVEPPRKVQRRRHPSVLVCGDAYDIQEIGVVPSGVGRRTGRRKRRLNEVRCCTCALVSSFLFSETSATRCQVVKCYNDINKSFRANAIQASTAAATGRRFTKISFVPTRGDHSDSDDRSGHAKSALGGVLVLSKQLRSATSQ